MTTSSLTELSFALLELYPNPNNGIFEIQISGVRGTTLEAKLFNTQGQHIADFLLNVSDGNVKQTIELSQKIAAGTYYLGIYDGSQSGLVQFIKE